jgi:uncharacterized protein (TIRG00374 family)
LNNRLKHILRYILFLGLGFVLLYFAYKDADFDSLWNGIAQANFFLIALSFVLGYLAIVARGLRWVMMLEPLDYKVRKSNSIHAVAIGYFANIFVPRSGELARCVALYRSDDVPVEKLFGTVIMERIIDSVMLLAFLALAFFSHVDEFYQLMEQADTSGGSAKKWLLIASGVGLLLVVTLLLFRKKIQNSALFQKVLHFLKGMLEGLKSVFTMKRRGLFVFYTFFIWIMYFFTAYLICFAIPETREVTVLDALFIVVAGGLGMVFPSPGGTGSYQFAVKLAFIALGFSGETGLKFATIVWFTQTFMFIIAGSVAALSLFLSRRERRTIPGPHE